MSTTIGVVFCVLLFAASCGTPPEPPGPGPVPPPAISGKMVNVYEQWSSGLINIGRVHGVEPGMGFYVTRPLVPGVIAHAVVIEIRERNSIVSLRDSTEGSIEKYGVKPGDSASLRLPGQSDSLHIARETREE